MDHPIYSGTVSDGFQDGLLRLIERIGPEECTQRKGVSLTGLSITHLNWKDTLADLTSLLNACGIGVNMCIGAGWTVEDIRRSASAELIVPVYPEYGDKVAEYYHDKFGTPVFVSPEGAPVGFEALETWIRGVCGKVGADPSPALKMIREKRTRTAQVVSRMDARNSLPKGRTFAVECDGSMAYATVRFLHEYLGMIPVAVRCTCGTEWDSRISEYLDVQGIPVSDEPEDTESDIIISSGPVCSAAVERGIASECLVIERPSHRSVFIDPAPPVGLGGTVSMLESVLEAVSRHHYFH
jgi:nitrogenase molybdenum-iron protein alpha/beta subunit